MPSARRSATDPACRAILAAGARVYGALGLDPAVLGPWLATRGGAVAKAHRADLCLVAACCCGSEVAWRVLTTRFARRLQGLLLRAGASVSLAEEQVQDLFGALLLPDASGAPRLASYDGSGALFAWLAVVAVRQLQRARRARATEALADATQLCDARTPAAGDCAADAELQERLRAAVLACLQAMRPRHRLAVFLRFERSLSVAQVAGILAVGTPRASRMLDRAVRDLRAAVQAVAAAAAGDTSARQVSTMALRDALQSGLATLRALTPPA